MDDIKTLAHTPGRWSSFAIPRVRLTGPGTAAPDWTEIQAYGIRAALMDRGLRATVPIAQTIITAGREAEAEVNARLIALAPRLLAYAQDRAEDGDKRARKILERFRD